MRPSIVGLLCAAILLVGSIHEGDSQFLLQALGNLGRHQQQRSIAESAPAGPSVTTADSEAFSRDVQVGTHFGINGGLTKSQSVTQNANGISNGEKSSSLSKGVKIGDLDLSSTLTGKKTIENGKVTKELSRSVNIGDIGIDSSLSKDNLKNGIGIRRSDDGGLKLNLGLLDVDLAKKKKQQPEVTGTNVDIQAVGEGATANTISNTNTQTETLGHITTTGTHSKSSGFGSVLKGLTGGSASGVAGGAQSGVLSGLFRQKRHTEFVFPDEFGSQYGQQRNRHPKPPPPPPPPRRPQQPGFGFPAFQQGGFSNSNSKSQVLSGGQGFNGGQRVPGGQVFPGTPGAFPNLPAANNNANAQGQAVNKIAGFQQQAGANTNSQNIVNEQGQFTGNTGSSISSNLANDGSSGQLSAANTGQQSFNTADGSGTKNAAQSQSLNFDKNNIQATSSNADTSHVKTATGERDEANSGASVNQQTQFGTATNTAQANTVTSNENGRESSQSNANSQSTLQGTNGGISASNTGATAGTVKGPDGFVSNTASSQASSFSNNGGPASASASSSSGTGPNGSFANSQGFTNGALSNAFTGAKRGQQNFAGGQSHAFGAHRKRPRRNVEPRTFDTILNLVQGLFGTDCNQCSPYMVATNQNNCCTKCCSPCCPQCCFFPQSTNVPPSTNAQPLLPPRPPLPPPPPPPLPRPQVPTVQITSAVFTPWYFPMRPCCSTCSPQIGAFPCGYGGVAGRPYPPPYNYYG